MRLGQYKKPGRDSSRCLLATCCNNLSLIALDSEELFLLPCHCLGIIAAFTCAYHVFSASLGGDVVEQCLLLGVHWRRAGQS